MYLFCDAGFFSIVESTPFDRGVPVGAMLVRARIKEDLDNLRATYMPSLGHTVHDSRRDYHYRAAIAKLALADGLRRIALAIEYRDFKAHIATVQGSPRAALYAEVHGVMSSAKEQLGAFDDTDRGRRFRRPRSLH